MWRNPISKHILLIHYVIYFWIFPYLEESWNLKNKHPSKKTQNGNTYNGQIIIQSYEIQMSLED